MTSTSPLDHQIRIIANRIANEPQNSNHQPVEITASPAGYTLWLVDR